MRLTDPASLPGWYARNPKTPVDPRRQPFVLALAIILISSRPVVGQVQTSEAATVSILAAALLFLSAAFQRGQR